jgi:hypothetical protein
MKTVKLSYVFEFPDDKPDDECVGEARAKMSEYMQRPVPTFEISTVEGLRVRPEFLPTVSHPTHTR